MPRNVRNFWIEIDVDGKRTRVETGPQAKDGGFSITIRQRDGGSIIRAMEVNGFASDSGDLRLTANLLGEAGIQPSITRHTRR